MIIKPLHISGHMIGLLLSSCLILLTPACAQESGELQSAANAETSTSVTAKSIDPATVELVEGMSSYLADQPALSVGWFISYETPSGTDVPFRVTNTWNGENTLVRGAGYYVVCEHDDFIKEYRYDGETFTAIDTRKNIYASTPIKGSMDALAETLGQEHSLSLPAWELFSANVGQTLLANIDRAEYVAVTSILGQPAHHLSFSEPGQDWEIWISTDANEPRPLMMAGHDPDVAYSGYQAMFHDWNTQPSDTEKLFTFNAPETMREIDFASMDDPIATNEADIKAGQ